MSYGSCGFKSQNVAIFGQKSDFGDFRPLKTTLGCAGAPENFPREVQIQTTLSKNIFMDIPFLETFQ